MDELAQFSPTAASAAVLSRFFGIKDGQQLPLDTVIDAIKLFNDLKFRREEQPLKKRGKHCWATSSKIF